MYILYRKNAKSIIQNRRKKGISGEIVKWKGKKEENNKEMEERGKYNIKRGSEKGGK